MALLGEIEEYLRGVMENNESIIEMSDSPIGSGGAKAVAAVLCLCDHLKEVQMANCEIRDAGAKCLFEELQNHHSV